MPRPVRPWFRFYTEAVSDRKLIRLSPEQRWIWVSILAAARESPSPGSLLIAPGVPMTTDELAEYAHVKHREVAKVLPMMVSLGMLVIDQSVIHVPNFAHRQFESDNITARTRAHRERSKERSQERSNVVPGNVPETETETETEKNSCASDDAPERFEEFWDTYDKKRDRKKSEQKYKLALKKRGVTADLLISSARSYIAFQKRNGQHPQFTKDPATWLNNESWNNELISRNATTNARTEDYDPFEKFAALGRMQSQAAMREQRQ